MIPHLEKCFEKAYRLESKLSKEILDLEGMTGQMTRHFYNNLLEFPDAKYLEIGTWKGSSSCAAMYKNKANITLMDDFSGFNSPRDEFMENFIKFRGDNDVVFIEQDCFKMDLTQFDQKFNIYLFDGDHSEESQYQALKYYYSVLEDEFIFIVDDWNYKEARAGTFKGIEANNLSIVWSKEIRLTDDDTHTHLKGEAGIVEADNTWWNGIAVFILKKL